MQIEIIEQTRIPAHNATVQTPFGVTTVSIAESVSEPVVKIITIGDDALHALAAALHQ